MADSTPRKDPRPKSNESSASTTYVWRRSKLRTDPAPQAARRPKGGRWSGLSRRPPEDRLTITVKYRGGSESWWHVEARGRNGAFPGWMGLDDVMAEINRSAWFYREE